MKDTCTTLDRFDTEYSADAVEFLNSHQFALGTYQVLKKASDQQGAEIPRTGRLYFLSINDQNQVYSTFINEKRRETWRMETDAILDMKWNPFHPLLAIATSKGSIHTFEWNSSKPSQLFKKESISITDESTLVLALDWNPHSHA